ncbi:MAG: protein translocase subunit SecF [Deltaproteobacteria bacterium]|nr:protein translocase subunit SecF [Deltaproteobacteria bacterium]
MRIINPDVNFDFVGLRRKSLIFSLALIAIGLVSLVVRGGPNYGIDFSGGTVMQFKLKTASSAAAIKEALKPLDLGSMSVQQFGEENREFLVRAQKADSGHQGLASRLKELLEQKYGADSVTVERVEMVGPQVGKDLQKKGLNALFWAMLAILAYITLRFEFRFAVGSVVALLHDVLITFGAFSLFNKEIDLPVIAAFLAIVGYSLNDTIIVYDRIRENMATYNKEPFTFIVNRSINETLSRTVLTSGTTLVVILALFLFGGNVINSFSFALLIGVIIGTYSSIFVASPLLVFWEEYWGKREGKKAPGKIAAQFLRREKKAPAMKVPEIPPADAGEMVPEAPSRVPQVKGVASLPKKKSKKNKKKK